MNEQKGMTLIEVLVAMLVLSVVSLSSVTVLTLAMRETEKARVRSMATSVATQRMEELTVMRYRGSTEAGEYLLPDETLAAGPPILLEADYNDINGFPEFRRVVTLSYDVPTAGMIQVAVEVFWEDLRQGEKSHHVTTFIHPSLHRGL